MDRQQIMDKCPEGAEQFAEQVINDFEEFAKNIRDKLDIKSLQDLDQLASAFDMATQTAEDLYKEL